MNNNYTYTNYRQIIPDPMGGSISNQNMRGTTNNLESLQNFLALNIGKNVYLRLVVIIFYKTMIKVIKMC